MIAPAAGRHGVAADAHRQLETRVGLHGREQRLGILRAHREARHSQRDSISEKDFRKGLADDGANAPAPQRLRRMLARRSAAEIRVDDEDRGAGIPWIVERMPRIRGAVVLEQVPLEPVERHGAKEARRHDAIGVELVAPRRQRPTFHMADG